MSSEETSAIENENAHESRERPERPADPSGEPSSGWGTDGNRSRDADRPRAARVGRRHQDWGDQRRRRPRRPWGDDRKPCRDWGSQAGHSVVERPTAYGDERRRGRRAYDRTDADDRSPTARADETLRVPCAVECDPVRRWGPVERVRTARARRAIGRTDRREDDESGRAGGRPDSARDRRYYRDFEGAVTEETGQGRRSF